MNGILKAYDPFLTKFTGVSNLDLNLTVIGLSGEPVIFAQESFALLEISSFFKYLFINACHFLAGIESEAESLDVASIKKQFRLKVSDLPAIIAQYESNDPFKHSMKDDFKQTKYEIWAFSKETRCIVSAYGKAKKGKDKGWEVIADMAVYGMLWADAALFHIQNNESLLAVGYAMKSQELYSIARAISASIEEHRANSRRGGQKGKTEEQELFYQIAGQGSSKGKKRADIFRDYESAWRQKFGNDPRKKFPDKTFLDTHWRKFKEGVAHNS